MILRKSSILMVCFSTVLVLMMGCATVQKGKDVVKESASSKKETTPSKVESLTIEGSSSVKVGETVTLTSNAYDSSQNSMTPNPTWSISDEDVATLDKTKGDSVTVTGVSAGMVFIKAKQNDANASHALQVK